MPRISMSNVFFFLYLVYSDTLVTGDDWNSNVPSTSTFAGGQTNFYVTDGSGLDLNQPGNYNITWTSIVYVYRGRAKYKPNYVPYEFSNVPKAVNFSCYPNVQLQ